MSTTKENTTDKISFTAKGLVLGTLWDNSDGAYTSKILRAETKKQILELAEAGIKDKSLDSGMGFQRLKGAYLAITKITTKVIDGKEFTNKETEWEFVGNLTEDEENFLETVEM